MEMLMSVIPLIGGGIFGAVVKLFSMSMQFKAEANLQMIKSLAQNFKQTNEINEYAAKNTSFSFTRRLIAYTVILAVLFLFIWPLITGQQDVGIYVKETVTTGSQWLFGLIDTRETADEWVKLNGAVVLPEVGISFQIIMGTFFGAEIAKKF